MSFGLGLTPRWNVKDLIGIYKKAEELGFENAWVSDYVHLREVFSTLASIALFTERIKLGTFVTNPFTRNPLIVASAISTLDEISDGRAILGLAVGDETILRMTGCSWIKPLKAMREAVKIIRSALSGEAVVYEGEIFKARGIQFVYKPKRKIPIYIGCRNPKMCELAGEISDGVLFDLTHPIEVKEALQRAKLGVEKSGRSIEQFFKAACPIISVGPEEKAKKAAAWVVALIVSNAKEEVLLRHDIKLEDVDKVKEALSRGRLDEAENYVTDEMMETFSIVGPVEKCISSIEELFKIGLDHLALAIVHRDLNEAKEQVEVIGKRIIPSFTEEK